MGISNNLVRNSRGLSLVEMLVVVGLMGLVTMLAMGSIVEIRKGFGDISKKAEFISSQTLLQSTFVRNVDCNCQFKGKIFNAGLASSIIEVEELKAGCAPDSPVLVSTKPDSGGQQVTRIYVDTITASANAEEFNAKVNIVPIAQNQREANAAVPLFLRFNTDPASPDNAKVISGCGPAPLTKPANVTTEFLAESCIVRWTPSAGPRPINYVVRYADIEADIPVGTNACPPSTASTTCQATGLVDGKKYLFAVQATNEYEATEFSAVVPCTPMTKPTEPRAVTAEPGAHSCKVKWSNPEKGTPAITYKVYRSELVGKPIEERTLACSSVGGNDCIATGLTHMKQYYFVVVASNAAGKSNPSTPEVSCKPFAPPTAPQNVLVQAGDKRCDLSWSDPAYGDQPLQYTVYRSEFNNAEVTGTAVANCNKMSFLNKTCQVGGLLNNKNYYLAVRAQNIVDHATSADVECKPGVPPGEVLMTATPQDKGCLLTWNAPAGDGPFEYSVYRLPEDTPGEDEPDTTPVPENYINPDEKIPEDEAVCDEITERKCNVTGLSNGKEYEFYAEAWNAQGKSRSRVIIACTPKEDAPPPPPPGGP